MKGEPCASGIELCPGVRPFFIDRLVPKHLAVELLHPRKVFDVHHRATEPHRLHNTVANGIDARPAIVDSNLSMKILETSAMMLLALAIGATAIFAQWPDYPTPGPRTKEGKVDLAAPPPRTADGKPDFSGLWEPARGPGGRGGQSMNGTLPLPFAIPTSPDDPPVAQFFNIGAGFKDGLLPFTPWATQVRDERKGNNNKDNPDALCEPLGLTQLHMHPQPRKIVQTPREIVVLYEANGNTRQILTDGRPLPNNNPTPWWYGYSVGTLGWRHTGRRDHRVPR